MEIIMSVYRSNLHKLAAFFNEKIQINHHDLKSTLNEFNPETDMNATHLQSLRHYSILFIVCYHQSTEILKNYNTKNCVK
jgi:hypothetical protein